jgi:hypothetical protein
MARASPTICLQKVQEDPRRPTLSELIERLAAYEPVEVDEPPAMTIRRLRDSG